MPDKELVQNKSLRAIVVARGGVPDECRLVFAKPFQHLTFRLGARLH